MACFAPASVIESARGASLEGLPGAWYALRVRANHERAVVHGLRERGIPEFLPVYPVRSHWADRWKLISRPLFPGYVFSCLEDEAAAAAALAIAGVVHVTPSNINPVSIDIEELENVRRVCDSRLVISPSPIVAGARVTIDEGALAGCSGVVVRESGKWRLVITVELFGRAVSVELERASVRRYASN